MIKMTPAQANKQFGTMFKVDKKNKYNAQKAEMGGKIYDSQGEMNYAWELKMQVRAGLIESFEEQVKESFYINDKFICNYFVDFKIYHLDKSEEFIEYKGIMTETARLKIKMLEAKYCNDKNIKVTIVWHKSKYKFKLK